MSTNLFSRRATCFLRPRGCWTIVTYSPITPLPSASISGLEPNWSSSPGAALTATSASKAARHPCGQRLVRDRPDLSRSRGHGFLRDVARDAIEALRDPLWRIRGRDPAGLELGDVLSASLVSARDALGRRLGCGTQPLLVRRRCAPRCAHASTRPPREPAVKPG